MRYFLVFLFCSCSFTAQGQIVLSLDVNDIGAATNTQSGFDALTLNSGGAGAAMGTFSGITVDVNGVGAGLDDRTRTGPLDAGALTQGAIYQDFIFTTGGVAGTGLDVSITGLTPNADYSGIIWSYDSGSNPARVSDWTVNSILVADDYAFTGSSPPTSDFQNTISFSAQADGLGALLISGRNVSGNPAVYFNGLQLTHVAVPEPSTWLMAALGLAAASWSAVVRSRSRKSRRTDPACP